MVYSIRFQNSRKSKAKLPAACHVLKCPAPCARYFEKIFARKARQKHEKYIYLRDVL